MIRNICTSWEKALRVIIGIDLFALYFLLPGAWAYASLMGIIPIVTVMLGYCPVKHMLGVTSCGMQQRHA